MERDIHALEAVEVAAWRDLFAAVPRAVARELDLAVEDVGGATLLVAGAVDHPLLNRCIGLGSRGPVPDADVAEVARTYARRGLRRCFVHVPADRADALAPALARSGLTRYRRAWVKLARPGGAALPPPPASPLTTRPAGPADAPAFGRLLAEGFDLPPAAAPLFAAALGRDRWHPVVACDGPVVVAAALLYVDGDLAYFASAATAPAHRRRGAQSLLLRARALRADALGCPLAVSETGEAVPGDPQHSYRNLVRHGFAPVAVRPNFAPAGTAWSHGARAGSAAPA